MKNCSFPIFRSNKKKGKKEKESFEIHINNNVAKNTLKKEFKFNRGVKNLYF